MGHHRCSDLSLLKSGQDRGIVFAIEISLIGQLARSKAR